MKLEIAATQDFEAIYHLLMDRVVWLKTICPEQWPLDWLESKKEDIFQSIQNQQFYIIKNNEDLIAAIELTTQPEEIWNFDLTKSLYIHKLAVNNKYKKKKLGLKILQDIEVIALNKGINTLRLDCVAINPFLKDFYLNAGFTEVGGAIDENEPVLLFEKKLKNDYLP